MKNRLTLYLCRTYHLRYAFHIHFVGSIHYLLRSQWFSIACFKCRHSILSHSFLFERNVSWQNIPITLFQIFLREKPCYLSISLNQSQHLLSIDFYVAGNAISVFRELGEIAKAIVTKGIFHRFEHERTLRIDNTRKGIDGIKTRRLERFGTHYIFIQNTMTTI